MKKTLLALITCTAAVALLAGCGSAAGASERDAGEISKPADDGEVTEEIPEYGGTGEEEILFQRPDPTIEVTAEEFQDMLGYSFVVPDGAQDVYYFIDTEINAGTMDFKLDGISWMAQVYEGELFIPPDYPYISEEGDEIDCGFSKEPAMQVHGVVPEVRGYRIRYSEDWVQYIYSANWFLAKENHTILLRCYSDTQIYSMPVEVFP